MRFSLLATAALAAPVMGEVYFKEQFNDEGWKDRWTVSTKWKSKSEMGEWKLTAGEWYGDEKDTGIKTSTDARFYGLSAAMSKPFNSSEKKDLVIQYSVKNEQKLDCGGAYIKLLGGGSSFDSAKFGGDTPYSVMFGPDICGSSNKRTHVIMRYKPKNENVRISKDIPCEGDVHSHLYTLVIRPDNTFEVFIDNESVRSGIIGWEFNMLPPREIKDPNVSSKPDDWVDQIKIEDPNHKKPEGYDDIPAEIPDPEAAKPDDWDDEEDGEWEPPMVDNPDWKPWKPKMIPNPDYKGPWEHPMIANPEYAPDDKLYAVCDEGCTHVGFELWQVKSGTLFDDIIVTDSLEEAQKFAEETFFKKKDGERAAYDEKEKKEEEARKAASADEDDDDDEDDEDIFGDEF
mmetsp:Transcript_62207/g.73686  ORF Transcript_62207/g.73686 Transcript_62207/m.73686 type:complete len:401 (+) Transcript_62207:198-1400(+)